MSIEQLFLLIRPPPPCIINPCLHGKALKGMNWQTSSGECAWVAALQATGQITCEHIPETPTGRKGTSWLPSAELQTYVTSNLTAVFKALVKVCTLTKCSSNRTGKAVLAPLGISGVPFSEKNTAVGGLGHGFPWAWLAWSFYIYL